MAIKHAGSREEAPEGTQSWQPVPGPTHLCQTAHIVTQCLRCLFQLAMMLLHGVKRDQGSGRMGVAGAQAAKDWAERLGASGSRPSMDMEVRCPGGRGA